MTYQGYTFGHNRPRHLLRTMKDATTVCGIHADLHWTRRRGHPATRLCYTCHEIILREVREANAAR